MSKGIEPTVVPLAFKLMLSLTKFNDIDKSAGASRSRTYITSPSEHYPNVIAPRSSFRAARLLSGFISANEYMQATHLGTYIL